MRIQIVLRYLGLALVVDGLFMVLSAAVSALYGDDAVLPLLYSGLVTLAFGLFPFVFVPGTDVLSDREGLLIVTGSWLLSCLVGSLPYVLWGGVFDFTNAWFESVSGFTTTGSSILSDVEALPRGLLFWRAATHWVGGVGIVLFVLAVLPFLGMAETVLFRSETSAMVRASFQVRSRNAVLILSRVYFGLTAAQTAALMVCGLDLFDAVTHAFATIATGGFSTRNTSVAAFDSVAVEVVIILFMAVSGLHFGLIFAALSGHARELWRSAVVRYYLGALAVATAVTAACLHGQQQVGWWGALRAAAFNVSSVGTSTGFATVDTSVWPPLAQLLLLLLALQCACSGSTSGGIKADRLVVAAKGLVRQLTELAHPRAAVPIRLDDRALDEKTVRSALLYIVVYLGIVICSTAVLAALGVDLLSGFSGVVACAGNVGPGLGSLGSMANFGHLSDAAKWVLSLTMLLGRLEIYALLLLLLPASWRQGGVAARIG